MPMNAILGFVQSVVGMIVNSIKDKKTMRKEALDALAAGVFETKSYLAALGRDEPPDRERELRICLLWKDAGIALMPMDPSLAQACINKAEYWAAPEHWEKAKTPDTSEVK